MTLLAAPVDRRNHPSRLRIRRLRLARRGLVLAALLAVVAPSARGGVLTDWIASKTAPAAIQEGSDGKTDRGLVSRWLTGDKTPFSSGTMGESSVFLGQKGWEKTKSAPDPVSEAEFAAAKKFFDAGDFARAEKLLTPLAKREVKKGTPWGEKAQFWLAETQFQRQSYVKAHDSFEILYKQYPSTDYTEKLVAREYAIAQIWLAPEDPKARPLDWKSRFDGRQPLVDSSSYAVKALDHVRHHDPTGPLADVAALRTADHYHAAGDFETAAVFYDQLLAEHPKSQLRERAQRSSIDAKMKGYFGPEYDVSGLEQARETIQKTITEFPERQGISDDLYHTLDLIHDQEAEREYTAGMCYVRMRKPISAEYQFGLVMAKWPKSQWAGKARMQMASVAKLPRQASLPSKMMTAPGAPDPSTMGGNGGNNGGANGALGGLMGGGGGAGGGGGMMGGGSPY